MSARYLVLGSLVTVFIALSAIGCGGQESGAQKLLAERKYQEVINKYPDTQFARRARALLAEDLLEQKKYDEVLKDFADTRAAYLAVQAQAKDLFDAKDYRGVITKFPNTTLAMDAERVLSNDLYNQGLFDSLIATYPNSDRGKDVKNARAEELFKQAKATKGAKQIELLEEITRSYNQSPIYKDAATLLSTLRGKTPPQVKPTISTKPAKKP